MRLPRFHFTLPTSRRGRIGLGLGLFAVVLLLGGAGYAWHRHSLYLDGPYGVVERLNRSIQEKDAGLFATIVDAGGLAQAFAEAAAGKSGHSQSDAETDARRTDLAQLAMLAVLRDEALPRSLREGPVPVLPENLRIQLVEAPFVVEAHENGPPMAVTTIVHPKLGTMPVRLELVPSGPTWRVSRVSNAPELVAAYRQAEEAQLKRQADAKAAQLEENRRNISRYIPVPMCVGGVTRISGNTPLLSLSMRSGINPGPESVESWGATFSLSAADGTVIAQPRLTLSSKIQPGSAAVGTWSVDIDETQFSRLDKAGPLHCTAAVDYIILTGGKIYKAVLP